MRRLIPLFVAAAIVATTLTPAYAAFEKQNGQCVLDSPRTCQTLFQPASWNYSCPAGQQARYKMKGKAVGGDVVVDSRLLGSWFQQPNMSNPPPFDFAQRNTAPKLLPDGQWVKLAVLRTPEGAVMESVLGNFRTLTMPDSVIRLWIQLTATCQNL